MPVRGAGAFAAGLVILSVMFLSVAVWNGFPLIFYDTGAYILEGLGHVFLVERSPVYAGCCSSPVAISAFGPSSSCRRR